MAAPQKPELLQIRGLEVQFETRRGIARAVNELDLTLYEGERFGLVGESGSGKTTTILGLLRLIEEPGRIVAGEVLIDGVDLLRLSEEEMRKVRLARISMIPQGAMNSLNPVTRIGEQMRVTILEHDRERSVEDADRHVAELLQIVGLKPVVARLYPHELSGGMKQRVCIATAISLGPRLILADEPTSALDVVVQRQIMQTLHSLQESMNATVLLVGHDMGLMAQFVERIGIMYGGKLVEVGGVEEIFRNPPSSLHAAAHIEHTIIPDKGQIRRHPRDRSVTAEPSRWVSVSPALSARPGHVQVAGAAACRNRQEPPQRRLPAVR